MSTEADIVDTVRAWAKAYRNTPEHRFPSDPHAEFFPVDLDTICNEVVELRAERDAAVLAERERCKKSVRNTICNMSWPPEDGDQLIDDLQAGIALFATSGKDAT